MWAVVVCLSLATAIMQPLRAQEGVSDADPLEPINRAVFGFNQVVDRFALKPAAQAYQFVLPQMVRTGVRNFLDNLRAPVIFANDLLQGEEDRAGTTLARFMINSTLGVFGIWDFAAVLGHEKHSEDFGQTLSIYGIISGPYLVLPVLGPSNPRDAVGLAVDSLVIDPTQYFFTTDEQIARYIADLIQTRSELLPVTNDLEANSIDLYTSYRTIYQQRRENEIFNGAPPQSDTYEDIFNDDAFEDPAPTD